jgi:hypothetical protein
VQRRNQSLTALLVIAISIFSATVSARAAVVGGALTTRDGNPAPDRQIHFGNRVTGDIFLVRTGSDGRFSADLPPGHYDLREERGPIIRAAIAVGASEQDLGKVAEPAGGLWCHLFEMEVLGPAIVRTPAPSTANLPGNGSETQATDAPSAPPS